MRGKVAGGMRTIGLRGAVLALMLLLIAGGVPRQTAALRLNAPGAPVAEDPFSILWLSDIQMYAKSHPAVLDRMTEWIAENAAALNVKYAILTGDLVHNAGAEEQWANVERSLERVEGVVPLFTIAGNHDMVDGSYDAYLSRFGQARFEALPSFGGAYEEGRGRYDLLHVGGVRLLLIGMSYGIDADGLDWMNRVLADHPDHAAIVCLHAYIDAEGAYIAGGRRVRNAVVWPNPNVKLVLCGHRHGVYHDTVAFDADRDGTKDHVVHQLLSNYQGAPMGGGGYLCILTFQPQTGTLHVRTYSPYYDDADYFDHRPGLESFTLPFPFPAHSRPPREAALAS